MLRAPALLLNWPIRRKIFVALGSALLCLGLIGLLASFSTSRLAETAGWTAHVHQVLGKADGVMEDLANADAQRCRFLLTRVKAEQDGHQAAYRNATQSIAHDLRDLRQLLADSPSQQHRLDRIEEMVTRKLHLLDRSIGVGSRFKDKRQVALSQQSQQLSADIRQVFDDLKAEENDLLCRWDAQSREAARHTLLMVNVGNLLGFTVVGLAVFGIGRDIRCKERDEDARRQLHRQMAEQVAEQNVHLSQTNNLLGEQMARCRQLEEQFRQLQKLSEMGRLVSGVAHDFNNVLTVIAASGEVALRQLQPDDPARELVGQILRAEEQAAGLARQLLALGRQRQANPVVLDLNRVVADMEQLARHLIGRDIELATTLAPGLRPVRADRGQLEQVILNLVVNARDAMPQGGKLTLETRNVELETSESEGVRGRPGVLLAVADTGVGMDESTLARAFEPFFTTKDEGKGTGLGLTTVQEIVRQAGGQVRVESAPGRGTVLGIYLPAAEEAESGRCAAPVRAGSETILLVDPDGVVPELGLRLLHQAGYTVLRACHGDEALRISQGYGRPIHLLITDVNLPRMSGPDLARRLVLLHPEMRVLYLAEGGLPVHVRLDTVRPDAPVLPKPFILEALGHKVREVLDRIEE